MSRSDACIIVTCDQCGDEISISLNYTEAFTDYATWDEKFLEEELESLGWHVDKDDCEDLCMHCRQGD